MPLKLLDLDVVATVASPNAVVSPLGGGRAAFVLVEALRDGVVVGQMVFGDLVRLVWEDRRLGLAVRHATLTITSFEPGAAMPASMPAELVPLLQRGATAFRERLVRSGDRLRVRGRVQSADARSFVPCATMRLGDLDDLDDDEEAGS